ncbi:MAG: hypothetical protein BKP49_09520 [Treponema sp. CETP13]|nr:MAG: hypothetical protein BKP49_09520 [Treponema sp. CETP13]
MKLNSNKLIPFLASLCLFLSAIEFAIPKPLPFMRLGLANMPIILALYILSWKEVFLLMFLKVFCQAILAGTLFSYIFVFSISGSFSSLLIMLFMYTLVGRSAGRRTNLMSPIGISLCGALANTGAQIVMSRIMLFGSSVRYIAPILLISGIFTGTILGLITALFMRQSNFFSKLKTDKGFVTHNVLLSEENVSIKPSPIRKYVWTIVLLFIGLPVLIFQKNLLFLWTATLSFAIVVYFKKGKLRLFMPIVIFLSITILNLYPAYGKILFTLGSFNITQGAFEAGFRRSGVLLGMVFLSKAAIDSSVKLPGKVGLLFTQILMYFEELTKKSSSNEENDFIKVIKKRSLSSIINLIDSKLLAVYG